MDIMGLLDSFEKQIGNQEKEVAEKKLKTSLYGEWADFDLHSVIEEREKWKEQLIQQGILKNEISFPIKGKTVKYSGNFINRAILNNCIENYKSMQESYFEKHYRSEIAMFPGCMVYIKKMMRNAVSDNIRFIKIVLAELNLEWDNDLDSEYLEYIEFNETEKYFDNLANTISQKMNAVARERFEKRQSGNSPEMWIGGEGIGGLIKGYVMGTAVNFGLEKFFDAINKAGDSVAVEQLKGTLNEVLKEVQQQVADLMSMFADLMMPFLLIKFEKSDIYYWLDVREDNCWKQMLEFSNYEYEHELIDDTTYWERLMYLLEEYPFVGEIYEKILGYDLEKYDLECIKELYMVADFFGLGREVLGKSSVCMAKLAARYKDTSVTKLTEAEVYELWDKYEKGIYDMDDIVMDDNVHMEKALILYDMYEDELYKLLLVDRTYFLKKREKKEEQGNIEETVDALWARIGQGKGIYRIDASTEKKLWTHYVVICSDFVKKMQIVQFEQCLQGLITHFDDTDAYKADFAKCVYSFFLLIFYKGTDSKKADDFLKDIYLAADRGVVIAKYFVTWFTEDEEEKERFLLEIVQNNFLATDDLKKFYLERFEKEKSVFDKACAERWKIIEECIGVKWVK